MSSWDEELPLVVRDMVGDTSASPKFTDEDLQGLIVSAARAVSAVAPFLNQYTTNRDDLTIVPDPTVALTRDDWFSLLICEKAACVLTRGQLIKTAGQAIRVVDAGSEIDLRDAFRARQASEKTWCAQFDKDLLDYRREVAQNGGSPPGSGAGGGIGRQVTGPIRIAGGYGAYGSYL